MEKVPVLLFDMNSGDRELIFATGKTLVVGLGSHQFRINIDKSAPVNIAMFDECNGKMDLIAVHDPAQAHELIRTKLEEDVLRHTIFHRINLDFTKTRSSRTCQTRFSLCR